MAEQDEIDPEMELEEDEVASEGRRWSQLEYTLKFTKAARVQALRNLDMLLGLARQSTDPKVAAAAAEYTQQKALCDVLAKAARGPEAKSGLP